MKTFTGKRDKIHKEQDEERIKNENEISRLNKDIVDLSWQKDQEKRRLEDPNLLKRHQAEQRALQSEMSQQEIEISIKESKIKELESQQKVQLD